MIDKVIDQNSHMEDGTRKLREHLILSHPGQMVPGHYVDIKYRPLCG